MNARRVKPRAVITGLLSYPPGVYSTLYTLLGGGGGETTSAAYCYQTWFAHLLYSWEYLDRRMPRAIAELGPGLSLGAGITGLLTGAETFWALDHLPYSSTDRNLKILDDLVLMLRKRASLKSADSFPGLSSWLDQNGWPKNILNDADLNRSLDDTRIEKIQSALSTLDRPSTSTDLIRYLAPWTSPTVVSPGSIDFVFSQAVLEHVEDIDYVYASMRRWLKPGAITSHLIDFDSHGTSFVWNGHWTISQKLWRVIRGKRPYSINRRALSDHLKAARSAGFEVLNLLKDDKPSDVQRNELAPEFSYLTAEDLSCRRVLLVLKKVQE